jgi:hypothetical protein
VDHWNSGPPWTGLHCRPEELLGAWPTAAPGLEATSQGQGRGVAHGQLDEPLTGAQVAVRLSRDGEGRRRSKAHGGGHSSARGKARRMVSGEARHGRGTLLKGSEGGDREEPAVKVIGAPSMVPLPE